VPGGRGDARAPGPGPALDHTGAGPDPAPSAGRGPVLGRTTEGGAGFLAGAPSTSPHSGRTTTLGLSAEGSTGVPSGRTTEEEVAEGSSRIGGASAGLCNPRTLIFYKNCSTGFCNFVKCS